MAHRLLRLTAGDAARYCALRGLMLRTDPWSFASAPGDDPAGTPEKVAADLADTENRAIFGIEAALGDDPNALVSVSGLMRAGRTKQPHIVWVWGVYTHPEARGRGHGRATVAACVELARTWPGVAVVNLSASARTPGAVALYESLGFVRWGVEPEATRIGDESADEIHLQLKL